jgi:hypothetical protein
VTAALFLGSIWCLFRLAYRNDMFKLFAEKNAFGGDYGIIVIYIIVLAVYVLYFDLNLEQVAKTVTQIGQLATVAGGAALVHWDGAGTFFGTRASVTNIIVLVLVFFFMSAVTLAFFLKSPSPLGRSRR